EEANRTLKAMGMEPIDPRQVEAQIDKQAQQMLATMKKSQPDFHKTMAMAGYTPEQADKLVDAALMTPPSPQAFPSPQAYDMALARYADRFAELTGASRSQRDGLVARLRHVDALQAEQLLQAKNAAALEAKIPQASLDVLAKAGFKADPKAYDAALEGLAGSGRSDAELLGSLTRLGTSLGLEPGAMKGAMAKVFGAVRAQTYQTPDIQGALMLAASGFPAQQGAMDRLRALLKSPPQGELFDLGSLARKAGVSDPELLALLEAADPLPMGKPEAPKPEGPKPETPQPEATKVEEAAAPPEEPLPEAEPEEPAPGAPPLLDGQHLAGANLAGLALAGAQLAGADLAGADLSGADLEGADFSGANLQGARLAGAKLDACDFTEADLKGADLSGARAHDAVFDRAVFLGTAVQGLDATGSRFSGTLFTEQELAGASLREAVLSQTRLENRVLAGCDLTGASLEEVWLDGCDFEQGQLGMARFDRCSVSGTSFRHANLAGSSWTRTRGVKADFRNALLANALFEECTFTMTRFTCMSARGCRMLSCDLWGSDLKRADMLGGALRGTKLGKCDLTEASLFDADLYLAGVDSETSFSGANLTRTCLALGEKP
ncbi:MAG: pentapeptide repeat-containing protein, partial [Desulfovibrio sp.]|nr:pentapeptide repeat-containing protein [Desulfovibrio sp.]